MWNPRATSCGHSSVLDWWGSKQTESFSRPLLALWLAAMQSVDSKYKPHCTSAHSTLKTHLHICAKTFSRVNMCRPQVIRTHIFCALVLGLQTSAYVHFGLASCTFIVLNAHHAYMCSLCTFVHNYSLYNAWTACSCCYFWPRLYSITNILLKISDHCIIKCFQCIRLNLFDDDQNKE